jgi:CRISPR-associated protein Cas1
VNVPISSDSSGPVLVVEGYGAAIFVERGHLVVRDGFPGEGTHREIRFPRGRSRLKRLVVRAPHGSISIAAVDWCSRMGIVLSFLGSDSRLANVLIPDTAHDGPLKRAQAIAAVLDISVELARDLTRRKLLSQLRVIETDFSRLGLANPERRSATCSAIRAAAASLAVDTELRNLLAREGYAARLYWSLLTDATLPWPDWTHSRVPTHWLRISPRELGATQQVRDATDPFNAMLNYAYTLLEVEVRVAVHVHGLDPDMGLLHVDSRARESLVYDLMDPIRSSVDVLCLEFARRAGLRPHMFHELRQGVVRLDPDIARDLAVWLTPRLQRPAQENANSYAAMLRGIEIPYRLSIRARRPVTAPTTVSEFGVCAYCGTALRRRGRKFCSRQCTLQRDVVERQPIRLAQARLAELKAAGRDPGHGGEAARRRGAKVAESNRRRAKYVSTDAKRLAANEAARRYRERKRAATSASGSAKAVSKRGNSAPA